MEPTTSWFLVGFVNTEPQQELLFLTYVTHRATRGMPLQAFPYLRTGALGPSPQQANKPPSPSILGSEPSSAPHLPAPPLPSKPPALCSHPDRVHTSSPDRGAPTVCLSLAHLRGSSRGHNRLGPGLRQLSFWWGGQVIGKEAGK